MSARLDMFSYFEIIINYDDADAGKPVFTVWTAHPNRFLV
jgi:hypothetical protein